MQAAGELAPGGTSDDPDPTVVEEAIAERLFGPPLPACFIYIYIYIYIYILGVLAGSHAWRNERGRREQRSRKNGRGLLTGLSVCPLRSPRPLVRQVQAAEELALGGTSDDPDATVVEEA